MPIEPLPVEAVRDLLGVARALRASRPSRILDAAIGDLETALSLAHCPAVSLGGRAARMRADRATAAIGEAVSVEDGALGLIEAAVARVRQR
jgi:hypothetical protein